MFNASDKESRALEEVLYTKVAEELERKYINKGLWTKALSDCLSDKTAAEALYIKLRAQNLKDQLDDEIEKDKKMTQKKVASESNMLIKRLFKFTYISYILLIVILALLGKF